MKLTERQSEILEFIRETLARRGFPPTRAEIVQAFGFRSPTAAEDHLRALARKGAIELMPGASRGIRLCGEVPMAAPAANQPPGLPLVGRVAAGSPLLAVENVEQHCAVDPAMFAPRADYLLRIHGESMRDIGMLDGDLLAVHRTPDARHGQIVVARLDDEVTVKRLERRGGQLRLLPENPDFVPIEVDPRRHSFAIEGLAVGLLRDGIA